MNNILPMVDQQIRQHHVTFTKPEIAEFVRLARAAGSGIGKVFGKDGSLAALYETIKTGCSTDQLATQLRILASNADATYASKASKYKAAVYYIERISGLSEYMRISVKPNTSNAVKFSQSATSPTATCQWNRFNGKGGEKLGASVEMGTLQLAVPTLCESLSMTVEDYMLKNPATTSLLLINVGSHDVGMDQIYDGRTCIEHINSVLELGAKLRMQLAILQDPSVDPATKTPSEAVFNGLKHNVG